VLLESQARMSRVGLTKLRAPLDKEQNKQRAMELETLVPARPASAYAIFLADPGHQARLEAEVLATGQVPSTATGRLMLSERSSLAWKLLEDAERERFVTAAVAKYQKYEEQVLSWEETADFLELQRCRAQLKLDFSGPATTFTAVPPSAKAAQGAHARDKEEPSAELAQPGATEAADAPAKEDAKKHPRPASKTRAKKKVEEAGKEAQAEDKDEVAQEVATPGSPLVASKPGSADQTSECNTPDGSKKRGRKKAAKEDVSQSTSEVESGKKRARAASKTELTAVPASEAPAISPKAVIAPKKPGKVGVFTTIHIPEEVAEKARLCNLDGALRNLAGRPQIVDTGAFSATDLLAALEKSEGLVNAAKDALLSVAALGKTDVLECPSVDLD